MTSKRPVRAAKAKSLQNQPWLEVPTQESGPSATSAQAKGPATKSKTVTVADRRKAASSPKAPHSDRSAGPSCGTSEARIKALIAEDPSIKGLFASPAEMATRRMPFKAGVNTEGIKEDWKRFVTAYPFEGTALPASRMPKAHMWSNDGQGYKDLDRECSAKKRGF